MPRALRITLITLGVIVLLLVAALVAATQLIDPNTFKPRISEMAREQAGLDLDIQGDLDWAFWPSLGLSLGRTETRLAGEEELFAALDEAHMGVAVWPLLFGEVRMDEIRLDGLNLNLVRTADGANWERIGPAGKDETGTAGEETSPQEQDSGSLDIPVTVPEIAVTDSRLRYRDTTADTDIRVDHLELNARDVTLEETFPVSLSLRYQDQADIRVDLELDTEALLEPNDNHYRLAPFNLTADVGGLTANPATIRLDQSLDLNLERERLRIEEFTLNAADTRTRGSLEVTGWSAQPSFSGQVKTEPFDANAALKAVGISPVETSDPEALSRVAFNAELQGTNSLIADPLTLTLDDSEISGRAGLADLDSGRLVADLRLDQMKLERYLPPEPEGGEDDSDQEETAEPDLNQGEASPGQPRPLSTEPLLPLETLRGINAELELAVGELSHKDIALSEAQFAVTADEGLIELQTAEGRALDGSFNATAQLDAREDTPAMQLQSSVTDMQIQPAVRRALERDLLKGILSLDTELRAKGNSEKALMDSARGTTELSLADGTLRGVNFHSTLIQGLNEILGRYQGLTAFLPTRDSGKLPPELSKDTKIVDLTSRARLEERVLYVEQLDAELRKGNLSGDGWLNLYNQDFDMTLGLQSPELGDSEHVAGRTWPLRCAGNLAGAPGDWCRPDREGFRAIGKEIAAQAAKERVKEEMGVEAEGDSAEEVIRNAAEKKAREKAKEEVEDKVKEELENLFR